MKTNARAAPKVAAAGSGDALGPASAAGVAWESPGEVSRIAGSSAELVRLYVRLGLIACAVDGSGRRSFPSGTGERVRALKAARMSRGASRRAVDLPSAVGAK